jgi:hypothetical protein
MGTASRRLWQAQLILIPRDQQSVHSTKSIPKAEQRSKMFYADRERAQAFGSRAAGWYWRRCGCSPDVPSGPFIVCLDMYRDALARLDM